MHNTVYWNQHFSQKPHRQLSCTTLLPTLGDSILAFINRQKMIVKSKQHYARRSCTHTFVAYSDFRMNQTRGRLFMVAIKPICFNVTCHTNRLDCLVGIDHTETKRGFINYKLFVWPLHTGIKSEENVI